MDTLSFGVGMDSEGILHTNTRMEGLVTVYNVDVITAGAYEEITGEELRLQPDEAAAYGAGGEVLVFRWDDRETGEEKYPATALQVVRRLEDSPWASVQISNQLCLVVADESVLAEIYQAQRAAYGADNASAMIWYAYLDLDCSDEETERLSEDYWEGASKTYGGGPWETMSWNSSARRRVE